MITMSEITDFLAEKAKRDALPSFPEKHGGDGGGMLEARVAKLESDVSYIKRDIGVIQNDVKSIDVRLGNIESDIKSAKTTFKATATVVGVIFATCTILFGTYVSKILDALNGLVLK